MPPNARPAAVATDRSEGDIVVVGVGEDSLMKIPFCPLRRKGKVDDNFWDHNVLLSSMPVVFSNLVFPIFFFCPFYCNVNSYNFHSVGTTAWLNGQGRVRIQLRCSIFTLNKQRDIETKLGNDKMIRVLIQGQNINICFW